MTTRMMMTINNDAENDNHNPTSGTRTAGAISKQSDIQTIDTIEDNKSAATGDIQSIRGSNNDQTSQQAIHPRSATNKTPSDQDIIYSNDENNHIQRGTTESPRQEAESVENAKETPDEHGENRESSSWP